jgi:branched-chain amino acid transport system ATP-binding protein
MSSASLTLWRPILAASLSIAGLDAGYGAVRILHDVSLSVAEGETVALLGTNGNGKSTLMKCIMGMVRPTAGSIVATIDGVRHELVGMPIEDIVDLGIGFVPEGRRLFPRLTVTENLLMGAFRKKARLKIQQNLAFCFEVFPRLAERRKQLAGSMSGGEQQMLALGRALMSAPRLLLIDEPSVGLAPLLVARTIDKIKELKDSFQLTVLMAEQNFTQAIRIANRGYVIVHGHIEFEGQSADELNNNELIRQFYLGGSYSVVR